MMARSAERSHRFGTAVGCGRANGGLAAADGGLASGWRATVLTSRAANRQARSRSAVWTATR